MEVVGEVLKSSIIEGNDVIMFVADEEKVFYKEKVDRMHSGDEVPFFTNEQKSGLMATVVVFLADTNVLFK